MSWVIQIYNFIASNTIFYRFKIDSIRVFIDDKLFFNLLITRIIKIVELILQFFYEIFNYCFVCFFNILYLTISIK